MLLWWGVVKQRGEAKLLTEDWEGAVEDLKSAAQQSPQVRTIIYHIDIEAGVQYYIPNFFYISRT